MDLSTNRHSNASEHLGSPTFDSAWVADINRLFAQGRRSTFELASAVFAGKRSALRGEWIRLFRCGRMPFSQTKGKMLARIGQTFGMPTGQTFDRLPYSWSVLAELARLDRETVDDLVHAGAVHPALTVSEAKALVAHVRGQSGSLNSSQCGVGRRLNRLIASLRRALEGCRPEEREFAKASLQTVIEHIDSRPDTAVGPFDSRARFSQCDPNPLP
jgi:hypothetical protein